MTFVMNTEISMIIMAIGTKEKSTLYLVLPLNTEVNARIST